MTTFRPGDRVHLKGHALVSSATGTVTGTDRNGDPLVRWDDNQAVTPHDPYVLEPAGEPMIQTFKSIAPDSKATIEVAGVDGNVTVYVHQNIGAIDLDAAVAPALALAILEAAGIVPTHHPEYQNGTTEALEHVAMSLKDEVSIAEHAAKEAADREALEAEARILFDAGTDYLTEQSITNQPPQRWDEVPDIVRAAHVIVARKARELHGVTK